MIKFLKMKKVGLILWLLAFVMTTTAQTDTGKVIVKENDVILLEEDPEGNALKVEEEGTISYNTKYDTVQVRLGKRGIKIIEKGDGTAIEIIELDQLAESRRDRKWKDRFRGHWAGVELGFTNLVTSDFTLEYPDTMAFMEMNTGKSWDFNINFLQYSLGFGTDKVGLVTGLGFELQNYRFDNPLSIKKENGVIVADSSYMLNPDVGSVEKSKLHTNYLTLPLLLEFQIPAGRRNHRIHISGGVIGGVKLWSTTKIKYKDQNGNKEKNKEKGNDYNLSPIRYGLTARIGYRALNIYANYNMTPFFEKNKGPELYPFTIGLTLLFF
jgi:hypothetical protein